MDPAQTPEEQSILTPTDAFRFACRDDLPCFTQCCRDVNIYLTPYDALRLRRALKMGSAEFLEQYTRHYLAKVTHIPVVRLAMDEGTLRCRLVTERGCSVYQDRPWSCRMYPLDLAPGGPGRYRLIVGSDRCKGLGEPHSGTVREWLEGQGVEPYEEMEQLFGQVMPAGFEPGGKMAEGLGRLLFLAYELDRFAVLVENPGFRRLYDVDDEQYEKVRRDDEELLKLAFRYIRNELEGLFHVS